jgi:hypothetical protein
MKDKTYRLKHIHCYIYKKKIVKEKDVLLGICLKTKLFKKVLKTFYQPDTNPCSLTIHTILDKIEVFIIHLNLSNVGMLILG